MLREIRVYGQLAKLLKKRKFRAEISTPAEAVRFLLANFPFLEKHMSEPDRYYRVSVGDDDLGADELHVPTGQQVIKIVPVVGGAGAVGRIIAGVALLVAAFAIPGFAAWAGPTAFSLIVGVGASLVLGGVAQLLTPLPKLKEDDRDPRKSFSFSGVQQTSRQGTPVPIIYGEVITGSVVVSAGLDTVQVAA